MEEKNKRFLIDRVRYTVLFVVLQVAAVVAMFLFFRDQLPCFYLFCIVLSAVVTIRILNSEDNPMYKIAWLLPVLVFPIFGGLLYARYGNLRGSKKRKRQGGVVRSQMLHTVGTLHSALPELEQLAPEAAMQARYIYGATGLSPVAHTQTEYYPIGEAMFAAMLTELEKAENYIFMEYFIIGEGRMWNEILTILRRKVIDGVEVRVMYDDLGSMLTIPRKYFRTLEGYGIKACAFRPFNSIMTSKFNNRDHRKICSIDGKIAFTGGVNLADEYINEVEKFGHWKDTGILLRGEAAWGLTVQFLSLWNLCTGSKEKMQQYQPDAALFAQIESDGYVQTYTDVPLDGELVGESVYLNMLCRAKRYVYITTPYLILDNEMQTILSNCAKCGLDVRIITPGIPDKKVVYMLTQSYYEPLLKAGVRIFEYTPGFIHAKTMVADDCYAVVGTINFDYRSFYLHYECAAWMYQSKAVAEVRADFEQTQAKCREITLSNRKKDSVPKKLLLGILHAIAPLF